ncbi:MAG: Gx transporter family protein [Actinomycetota bacterium]|nr:Gx transporter family protein [Actinomycetota bacterium]
MQYRADHLRSRATAMTAMFLALASVLGLVEAMYMPPLPVPGAKIGLANLAVLLALVFLGPGRALFVSLGRVLVVGLATGMLGGPPFVLSMSGALVAWLVMWRLSAQGERYSVVGLSLGGAAGHTVAQLVAAVAVIGSAAPLLMMPYSLGMACFTGLAIGFTAHLLLSRLPQPALSVAR